MKIMLQDGRFLMYKWSKIPSDGKSFTATFLSMRHTPIETK